MFPGDPVASLERVKNIDDDCQYNLSKIDMCLHHLDYLNSLKDEHLACLEIRNHIGWYLKGMKDGNIVKNNIYQTSNIRDIIDILNEFKEGLDE